MLSKKIRLTTSLFDQVFKTGVVMHSFSFWLRYSPAKESESSRFAIAVPKKIAKTAVLRNKIKRMMYRAIDTLIEQGLFAGSANYYVFGIKNDISKTPFSELVDEIKKVILKKGQK